MVQVPYAVFEVCLKLAQSGHRSYLVGGAVRDSLMGREAHDFDIATSARPEEVLKLFSHVVPTGLQHGTVTVIQRDMHVEVTTFRGDGEYSDGRRPDEVQFVDTIEEDLGRRDFTANALAYDPLLNVYVDPFNGRKDIEDKVLRAVGDPLQRFQEDGLRVLRAARFAATLEFDLDPATKAAIRPSLDTYAKVAPERIQVEWLKAMAAPKPSRAFRIMQETGILETTVPEMVPMFGCTQNRYHAYDVWEHTLLVVDSLTPDDPILRMAALFHDVSKPASKGVHPKTQDATFYNHEEMGAEVVDAILTRLKFSTADRERIVHLVRHHLVKYEPSWVDSAIRRWVRKVGKEHVASLTKLARADIEGKGPAKVQLDIETMHELDKRIAEMRDPIVTSTNSLAINGKDVMDVLGFPPGPQVGIVLKKLLDFVTENPESNTRERLLEQLSHDAIIGH